MNIIITILYLGKRKIPQMLEYKKKKKTETNFKLIKRMNNKL